jgi:hypothetical protein
MICLFSHWFSFLRPVFLIALAQAVALAMLCLFRSLEMNSHELLADEPLGELFFGLHLSWWHASSKLLGRAVCLRFHHPLCSRGDDVLV